MVRYTNLNQVSALVPGVLGHILSSPLKPSSHICLEKLQERPLCTLLSGRGSVCLCRECGISPPTPFCNGTLCLSLTARVQLVNKPKPCQVQVTRVLPVTNSSQAKITYGDTSRRVSLVEAPSRREVDLSPQILPSLR